MTLRDRVVDLIEQGFCQGKQLDLSGSDSFLEHGILDSLRMVELIERISRKFSITVEDDDLMPENLDSIDGLTHFLASKGARD